MPLSLEFTAGVSHWWAPAVSVWSLLLSWLMANTRLCKLSLQLIFVALSWSTTVSLSFLELTEEDCFGHAYVFHPRDVASPAQLHLKQDGHFCWANWLSQGLLLRSARGLAIWCHGWNLSSVDETAPVDWFASDRQPRSLHRAGGWEQRRPCISESLWRGGASDSVILSLTIF